MALSRRGPLCPLNPVDLQGLCLQVCLTNLQQEEPPSKRVAKRVRVPGHARQQSSKTKELDLSLLQH